MMQFVKYILCASSLIILPEDENLVLIGGDNFLGSVAREHFGYTHQKGLDFICRANNIIVLGETKFLTDMGGHQNAQFNDALATLHSRIEKTRYKVKVIAILDGVQYIPNKNKMYVSLQQLDDDDIVISSLLLRDYLYFLHIKDGFAAYRICKKAN